MTREPDVLETIRQARPPLPAARIAPAGRDATVILERVLAAIEPEIQGTASDEGRGLATTADARRSRRPTRTALALAGTRLAAVAGQSGARALGRRSATQAESASRRRRARWLATSVAASAAVGVGAVIVVTGGSGGTTANRGAASASAPAELSQPAHPSFVLEHLAQSVAASAALPGNATLVHYTTKITGPGEPPGYSGYDLYEDNGDYYWGHTLADLQTAAAHSSKSGLQGAGLGKVVAAAASVAGLSPRQAAEKLLAADPHPTPHVGYNTHTPGGGTSKWTQADVQRDLDAILWGAITAALEGGAGQPQVRAGALQAASAMANMAVRTTSYDGQSAYQIIFHNGPSGYIESAIVNRQTGVLLNEHGAGPSSGSTADVTTNTTFKVMRVTAPRLTPIK
jgi:hypothetical protein